MLFWAMEAGWSITQADFVGPCLSIFSARMFFDKLLLLFTENMLRADHSADSGGGCLSGLRPNSR